MKVILLKDVKGQGVKGDIVEVSVGYAQNYLIKNNLAQKATQANVNELKAKQKSAARAEQREKEEAEKLQEALKNITVEIKAKAGEGGRLFGSITNKQIAEVLEKDFGHQIDRRKIELAQPIRALGNSRVPVRLHQDVMGQINVHVTEK